jgi:hypothetical protein
LPSSTVSPASPNSSTGACNLADQTGWIHRLRNILPSIDVLT